MKSLVGKMNNITILDACTIINILHIDDEDDFLFKQMKQLDIFLPPVILEEVDKNRRKKQVDESKEHQIDRNFPQLYAYNENIDDYEKDGTLELIKEFTEHTKKENGELLATALALKLSREWNTKVFFYTDDFPAHKEFADYFGFQQIGQIQDSVDLLIFLYRLNKAEVFPKQKLQQYLSMLSAEYNLLSKKIVDAAEEYKLNHVSLQNKKQNKNLYYAIDAIIQGFYNIDSNSFKKGIDFFRTHTQIIKEIDEIICNYSFDNIWDMEICKKIRCVLSYMNKYDIVQLS